jgi:hypothetical protein
LGLDLVEYVQAVEEFFEVRLPDAELREARTPRDLAKIVKHHLPAKPERAGCLGQRSFYLVRNALLEANPGLKRRELRAHTPCHTVAAEWSEVGEKLKLKIKDHFYPPARLSKWLRLEPPTLATLSDRLIVERANDLKNTDESWSDGQLIEILLRLVEREQGLDPHYFNSDSKYVQDMQMD